MLFGKRMKHASSIVKGLLLFIWFFDGGGESGLMLLVQAAILMLLYQQDSTLLELVCNSVGVHMYCLFHFLVSKWNTSDNCFGSMHVRKAWNSTCLQGAATGCLQNQSLGKP